MAVILNILTGLSFNFKVPISWIPKIQLLVKLCQPMALQAGEGPAPFSVKMGQRSQSYLQLGWKFQQCCWNVTYWLILVTWEPFMRTSYLAPEEAYIDSLYPLEEEFLGSWKTLGAILLEARRPEGIPGSPLKELRWESQDLSSTGDQTQYYLIECSSSSKQGCYCYCFFPFVKE